MKTFKNIIRFSFMTFTSAITTFFFCILLCRTDLIVDLFDSKPVLLIMGLTIGTIIGLLVGFITTYLRFAKIVDEKNAEVNRMKKDLKEAKKIVSRLLPEVQQARKLFSDKSIEEANRQSAERSKQVISEIAGLSNIGNKPAIEEEVAAGTECPDDPDDEDSYYDI